MRLPKFFLAEFEVPKGEVLGKKKNCGNQVAENERKKKKLMATKLPK